MYKHKLFLLSTVLLLASFTSGCCFIWPFCDDGDPEPQSGFTVKGEARVQTIGGGTILLHPAFARGAWQFDNGSALGEIKNFSECCGERPVPEGRVPARWVIVAGLPGECIGQITNPVMDVSANDNITVQCLVFGIVGPFVMSPGAINLLEPPATISMAGGGLTTMWGMPRLEYIDPYTGQLIAVTLATNVSRDGTVLEATTPDLSTCYSGTLNVLISNANGDGTFEYVGTATVDAYGRDYVYDPPPPPPGGCGCPPDGQMCLECTID